MCLPRKATWAEQPWKAMNSQGAQNFRKHFKIFGLSTRQHEAQQKTILKIEAAYSAKSHRLWSHGPKQKLHERAVLMAPGRCGTSGNFIIFCAEHLMWLLDGTCANMCKPPLPTNGILWHSLTAQCEPTTFNTTQQNSWLGFASAPSLYPSLSKSPSPPFSSSLWDFHQRKGFYHGVPGTS